MEAAMEKKKSLVLCQDMAIMPYDVTKSDRPHSPHPCGRVRWTFFSILFSIFFWGGNEVVFFFHSLFSCENEYPASTIFWKHSPFSGVYFFFMLPHFFFDSKFHFRNNLAFYYYFS